MKRPTLAQMQAACDDFNNKHDVGDVIRCWPGVREGDPVKRTTTSPACILQGHTAVVYVSGGGGTIALTHVLDEEPEGICVACAQPIFKGEPYHVGADESQCAECAPTYGQMLAEPEAFVIFATGEPMTADEARANVAEHLAAGGSLDDKMVSV